MKTPEPQMTYVSRLQAAGAPAAPTAQAAHRPTRPMNPLDRLIGSRPEAVHKIKARDSTGRWAYYFVYVDPAREPAFTAALKSDHPVDLLDYGVVVGSNYGEVPSDATLTELEHRFGWHLRERPDVAPPQSQSQSQAQEGDAA